MNAILINFHLLLALFRDLCLLFFYFMGLLFYFDFFVCFILFSFFFFFFLLFYFRFFVCLFWQFSRDLSDAENLPTSADKLGPYMAFAPRIRVKNRTEQKRKREKWKLKKIKKKKWINQKIIICLMNKKQT